MARVLWPIATSRDQCEVCGAPSSPGHLVGRSLGVERESEAIAENRPGARRGALAQGHRGALSRRPGPPPGHRSRPKVPHVGRCCHLRACKGLSILAALKENGCRRKNVLQSKTVQAPVIDRDVKQNRPPTLPSSTANEYPERNTIEAGWKAHRDPTRPGRSPESYGGPPGCQTRLLGVEVTRSCRAAG